MHFRARAAAEREAKTMQHLGEVCMAQRSRGKSRQDTRRVKARKEIQKRSFWRRFFSSFLSLLKEKRPPEAKKRGTDSHASDVGHWLGMTGQGYGAGTVDGCRGGRPHAAAVCAYITGHRPLALPLGELSPQVTERAGMVIVCPLRPRCARPPLPEGEARVAHTAHQNVCRGGRLCPPGI